VLFDLRRLFATLPDGRYKIFLIRTENNSRRLVIEVDVRNGRVIDTSDDSEGTRDRPPTSEGVQQIEVVPLEANPPREQPPEQPEDEAAGGAVSESAAHATIPPQSAAVPATYGDELVALPPVRSLRWVAPLAAAGLAANGGWSQRVMRALEGADERAWQRLRRAGRLGRSFRRCQTVAPPANNTNGKYNGA
ncbi:MAG: hypothetical protein L0Z07_01915, partial [Planctomycetes bacterium]|nr:hypothetical protein [Planctomycetota bacterium]